MVATAPETTKEARYARQFASKREAAEAAHRIGWRNNDARPADVFGFRVWTIQDEHGNMLTPDGYAELFASRPAAPVLYAWGLCSARIGSDDCRTRIELTVDVDGLAPVRVRARHDSDESSWEKMPPVKAIPYMAWCVAHKAPLVGKLISVNSSRHPCDPRCTKAQSTDCSCECGGAHHGEYA